MNKLSKLVIFDPTLKSFNGHAYFYNLSVAEASTEYFDKVKVYAHPDLKSVKTQFRNIKYINTMKIISIIEIIHKNLKFMFFKEKPKKSPKQFYDHRIKFLTKCIVFMLSLLKMLLRENTKREKTTVFIQYATLSELYVALIIDRWLLQKAFSDVKICMVLRYDPEHLENKFGNLQRLSKLKTSPSFKLFTDSQKLTESYRKKFGELDISTIPVPVYTQGFKKNSEQFRSSQLTVGFLGATRKEKGFEHLPEILRKIQKTCFKPNLVPNFCIQINSVCEPGLSDTVAELQSRVYEQKNSCNYVEILNGPLDVEEYLGALEKIDVMLLPYISTKYLRSTSGLFMEAIQNQIVVVCSKGTWSSEIIENASLNRLRIGECFTCLEEIPSLVKKISLNYLRYQKDISQYLKLNSQSDYAKLIAQKLT